MNKNSITIITRQIENGRTGFGEAIINAVESLEGKRAKITIEEYKRPRSNKQNRYYFGVVLKAYQDYFAQNGTFMTREEMHDWIKEYVWEWFIDVEINGIAFRKILTSTILNTQEWENLMFLSRQFAIEKWQLNIPEPNELIDQHVKDWLENPSGISDGSKYRNYFTIEK